MSNETLEVAPTPDPKRVRTADGRLLTPPAGWALLPPGDAGLTRRVKAAGPSWTVIEKKGRKRFSQGVWAPAAHIETARAALTDERGTEAYAKRRVADVARRERDHQAYVIEFANEVLAHLRFSPAYEAMGRRLAVLITEHATPVGSGTVARTERIPIERRAEAALIAWLRHQTTSYDDMRIERVKGRRREVRRELAEVSRALLSLHRRNELHAEAACELCLAVKNPRAASAG